MEKYGKLKKKNIGRSRVSWKKYETLGDIESLKGSCKRRKKIKINKLEGKETENLFNFNKSRISTGFILSPPNRDRFKSYKYLHKKSSSKQNRVKYTVQYYFSKLTPSLLVKLALLAR